MFGADFSPEAELGNFSLKNQQGEAVTDNGDRYRAMLNEFFFLLKKKKKQEKKTDMRKYSSFSIF